MYWTIHGKAERQEEAAEAFKGAEGHFRRVLARALDLRVAPDVKFFYDNSLDERDRMEKIFESIRAVKSE